MMHERHFKEAFALSIYNPAIDGLSADIAEVVVHDERDGQGKPVVVVRQGG